MSYSMILTLSLVLFSQASCLSAQVNAPVATNAAPGQTRANSANAQEQLFRAIIDNNVAAVADALAKGADPNATTSDPELGEKLTPLAIAVTKDEKIVRMLLEKGADPNTFSDFYVGSHRESRSFSPLMRSASLGRAEIVRLLIDSKADVNRASRSGVSPLIAATSNTETMELLLKNGADPNAPDAQGVTPLIATVSGAAYDKTKADRARLLIEAGADPNAKDKNGRSALDVARSYGDASMIELLQGGSQTAPQTVGIGFVKNAEAPGCYMAPVADAKKAASERRYYFVDSESGGLMNLDGRDVEMTRTGSDELAPLKGKKRFAWTFRSPNATARFDLTVTRTANDGEAVFYDALITVTNNGKKHSVKAFGFCGG